MPESAFEAVAKLYPHADAVDVEQSVDPNLWNLVFSFGVNRANVKVPVGALANLADRIQALRRGIPAVAGLIDKRFSAPAHRVTLHIPGPGGPPTLTVYVGGSQATFTLTEEAYENFYAPRKEALPEPEPAKVPLTDIAESAQRLFDGCVELINEKSRDYGDAWKRQGWMGNLARIMSKVARLESLLWHGGEKAPAVEETVDDTARDLINLTAFFLLNRRLRNRWGA